QCGYDVEKALDVLLDLSASSHNKEGCTGVYNQKFQDGGRFVEFDESEDDGRATCQFPHRMSGSTFDLSEKEIQQILQSSDYDYRNYAEVLVGPKKQTSPAITEQNLPQKVLESLFKVPKNPTEEPDSMNWKNVVKKMESIGQVLDVSADGVARLQQNAHYAKGEDYKLCRKSANQHYDAMKTCYQKAANAYSRGQRSYASYLSEQGKVHNKVAREADVKASQEIFESRNKGIQNTVTIDLHGQHVKQAIKLLKVHLFVFTTYVPSVQLLRVITGCGTHGIGKSKLKQSVIDLVEKGGIEWSEENRGIVLVKLDGQRYFNFVESEDDSE
ncbi:Smr domain-containing protein, partial [Thalictrum thalictroides]